MFLPLVFSLMKIEEIETDLVIPYEFNNRIHNETQVNRIANSIKEFGFNQPIVIDESNIILVGHGRLLAAKKLGLEKVPVLKLINLLETQKKAYRILDNKLQNDSTWDFNNLELELGFLEDNGLDFKAWGLDELSSLISSPMDQVSEDAGLGELPDEPFIKSGDLIELGNHRLICGDSTDPSAFKAILGDVRPTLIFTDPPYGVAIGAKNRFLNSFQKAGRNLSDIKDDDIPVEELKAVLLQCFNNAREIMADDCTIFVCSPPGGDFGMMMMMMQEAGLRPRHTLVWKKNAPTFSMGRLDYDYQHESIILTWGKKHKRPMQGEFRTSVWEVDRPRKCDIHPTMKPIKLSANAMLNNSDEGDPVLDFFMGSGSTLIAAEQTGRRAYGIELEPGYCQAIIERFQKYCTDNNKPFECKINGQPFNPQDAK